jgi:probable HAF family extracellular repeat protein
VPLPGFSAKSTFANAINPAGVVVGQSDLPTQLSHGFSSQNGVLTDITPTNRIGQAAGINSAGAICGYAYFTGVGTRAYVLSQGSLRNLGTLGGASSFGNDINNSNQVVGMSTTAAGVVTAFLNTGSTMISIAPVGATWSRADAVNDLGWAVGYYRADQGQGYRGFFYDGSQTRDVEPPSGTQELSLRDINNNGTAVGYATIDANHGMALKYEQGVLVDLSTQIASTPPLQLGAALAINNLGWIAVLASPDGVTGVTAILRPVP